MGNMVCMLVGMAAFMGFNAAMDTLQSHAAGAGLLELCGIYLWRARTIIFVLFVPISIVMFNTEAILLKLGQQPLVAKYSQ